MSYNGKTIRRVILIFFVCILGLNYFNNVSAKTYRVGTTFENEIEFSKSFVLPLSDGKWEVVDKYTDSYAFLYFKGNAIVRVENNELMELIWVEKANLSGTHMGLVDSAVNEIMFKDQYDGCYERPEYFIVEVYKKGGTHNCLTVRHVDSNKELFAPDDPQTSSAKMKKWLRENSITLPSIGLASFHSYFSRLSRGEWYVIQYLANPKLFNSPQLNYLTEDSSEFHKTNIQNHPKHKITMDKWISVAAKRHRHLENLFNAKEHHLLDLDKYIFEEDIKDVKNEGGKKNIVESLNKLNELYKSGAITKEEFNKAKDKILN